MNMARTHLFLGLLMIVKEAYGHFSFPSVIVNGTVTQPWQYVRDLNVGSHVGGDADLEKAWPITNLNSNDMICNNVASGSALKTLTVTINAGDEVGFKAKGFKAGDTKPIFHGGPGQAYLSKAPNDDVEHYDGKGDWFKIGYAGPKDATSWKLYGASEMRFTIPKTTPPGKYLMRMEFIAVEGQAQFYTACAHVNIVGPGGGKPTGFVKFPGGYPANDPGLNFYSSDLTKYTPPGPALWQG